MKRTWTTYREEDRVIAIRRGVKRKYDFIKHQWVGDGLPKRKKGTVATFGGLQEFLEFYYP